MWLCISGLLIQNNATSQRCWFNSSVRFRRLATMLRQLAQYHAKNTGHLFMVRIAQGLTHLGKGTLSLSPFHTDRQIMNPVAVAGLLITLTAFLDTKNSEYPTKFKNTLKELSGDSGLLKLWLLWLFSVGIVLEFGIFSEIVDS